MFGWIASAFGATCVLIGADGRLEGRAHVTRRGDQLAVRVSRVDAYVLSLDDARVAGSGRMSVSAPPGLVYVRVATPDARCDWKQVGETLAPVLRMAGPPPARCRVGADEATLAFVDAAAAAAEERASAAAERREPVATPVHGYVVVRIDPPDGLPATVGVVGGPALGGPAPWVLELPALPIGVWLERGSARCEWALGADGSVTPPGRAPAESASRPTRPERTTRRRATQRPRTFDRGRR